MTSDSKENMRLDEFAELNPKRRLTKGTLSRYVDMAALPTSDRSIAHEAIQNRAYKSGACFQNHDTLLARITPCLENGKSAFVNFLADGEIAAGSTEFIVLSAQNPSEADFVYYASCFPGFRNYAISRMEGTSGRQRVAHTSIGGYKFPYIAPRDRLAISRLLRSIDDRIDHNRALATNLESIARAIFKSWFIDFDPVRAKAAGEQPPGLDEDIAALFPDRLVDSELGAIPEGWGAGVIGDIANNIRDSVNVENIAPETPYIGLEHFTRRCLTLWDRGSGADVTSNKSAFRPNDVLFGKLRPYFHKVAIAPNDGICSTDVLVVRASGDNWQAFTAMALFQDSVIDYATKASSGTRMPRTKWQTLAGYPQVLPDDQIAGCFQTTVGPLLDWMGHCVRENDCLRGLRDTLLPRLISGKLRVEDAEREVAEAMGA
ncbi:restriction endonuclease subunit S [Salinisphaera orenii]|uniref:restriction endonuclease subunit S n=1 Tax=Salinisphaera orenii TaxID=856731 RepID=UPI0013A65008